MFKQCSLLVLALGLSACSSDSEYSVSFNSTPTPTTPDTSVTSEQFAGIETIARQEMSQNSAAAVSIAIYHEGEVVYAQAFGNKVFNTNNPVNKDTLFQLGSTTKMFTALATLQLVEEGKITLNDYLVDVIPSIQRQGNLSSEIKIEHLLTHKAGLMDSYSSNIDNAELVDYMQIQYPRHDGSMNPPGIFYNYSNPNWSYLGAVVESLEGVSYAQAMRQKVYQPLGMARTTVSIDDVIEDGNYALGVQLNDNNNVAQTNINQVSHSDVVAPAGSQTWSTPTELLKMAEFLIKGNTDVLAEGRRQSMTNKQVNLDLAGLPMHYGYGIFVADGFSHNNQWYSTSIWEHGGNTDAHTSMFWILPELDVAVSIMSSGVGDSFIGTMMTAVRSVADLPAPQVLPLAPTNREDYEKHIGTYITQEFTVQVSQNGDQLYVDIPELDAEGISYRRELEAIGDNTFSARADGEDFTLTFIPETNDGESVYLRNRQFVGIKEGYQVPYVNKSTAKSKQSLKPKLVPWQD